MGIKFYFCIAYETIWLLHLEKHIYKAFMKEVKPMIKNIAFCLMSYSGIKDASN